MIRTAADYQRALMRWLGSNDNPQAIEDCREAINDALKEVWGEYDWPWYQGQQTIIVNAPYDTGTITYDASTRRFTLTGGTWPEWAEYGAIQISSKYALVDRLISSTVIEIEEGSQFTADISTATAFKIWRSQYPLPNNIRKITYLTNDLNTNHVVKYVTPLEFADRRPGVYGLVPVMFTVQKDRRLLNGLNLVLWPYPSTAYTYRFSYVRHPEEVAVWSVTDGKVTTAADDETITGTGTAFLQEYAGALIRIGRDGTNIPTAKSGLNPRVEEALIDTYSSTTILEARTNFTYTNTLKAYEISSVIDIDESIMASLFMQQCYLHLGNRRNKEGKEMSTINAARQVLLRRAISKASPEQGISYAGNFRQSPFWRWCDVGVY